MYSGFILSILICIVILYHIIKWLNTKPRIQYYKSIYYHETKTPYKQIRTDKGAWGEYLTASNLDGILNYKKVLFNIYVPKMDAKETTEIDILLITENGLTVIENKNYSAKIYGKEHETYWTAVYSPNSKYKIYNPIKQNENHIKYIKNIIDKEIKKDIPYLSVIVYNENATFSNIQKLSSENVILCNTKDLIKELIKKYGNTEPVLNNTEIKQLYNMLKEYQNKSLKEEHILSVKKNLEKNHPTQNEEKHIPEQESLKEIKELIKEEIALLNRLVEILQDNTLKENSASEDPLDNQQES